MSNNEKWKLLFIIRNNFSYIKTWFSFVFESPFSGYQLNFNIKNSFSKKEYAINYQNSKLISYI